MQPAPSQPPPMYPYPPLQAGYPYPPPYYVPPRRDDTRLILIVVVVVIIILVIVPIVIAAALYVMVSGLIGGPGGPGIQTMGISVQTAGTNWSLQVVSVSGGPLPATTFLTILDDQGGTLLARRAWSGLTLGTWFTFQVVYEDSDPSVPEIVAGDGLVADRTAYPAGSVAQISSDQGVLWAGNLR